MSYNIKQIKIQRIRNEVQLFQGIENNLFLFKTTI